MREPKNIEQVAQLGVDMMGFIFILSLHDMLAMCWLVLMQTGRFAEWEFS